MQTVVEQLKQLRGAGLKPRAEWVAQNRATLLSQIKNTVPSTRPVSGFENAWSWLSIYMPRNTVYSLVRPVAVLLVVALVGTSGAIAAVDASYEALPGDFLYPAARLTQQTQVAVAGLLGGQDGATKARVKITEQLAAKTQKISHIDDDKKATRLAIAVADLKTEMANMSSNLDQTQNDSAKINPSTVQDVKANADQINSVLQTVKNELITSNNPADKTLTENVTDAKNLAKDVGVKAVAVLVQQHVDGNPDTKIDDVKDALRATVERVVTEAGNTKDSINDAKTIVDAVKSEVKEMVSTVSTSTTNVSTTTAADLVKKINTVSNQTVAAVIKTDAAANDARQKANEATVLINSGDLVSAVNKLKEATDASKVVEKISDTAIETVKSVVPVVAVAKEDAAALTNGLKVIDAAVGSTSSGAVMATTTVKIAPTTTTTQK